MYQKCLDPFLKHKYQYIVIIHEYKLKSIQVEYYQHFKAVSSFAYSSVALSSLMVESQDKYGHEQLINGGKNKLSFCLTPMPDHLQFNRFIFEVVNID